MTFAHTRLLLPKTLPSRRDAVSSTASVVMPLTNAIRYRLPLLSSLDWLAARSTDIIWARYNCAVRRNCPSL